MRVFMSALVAAVLALPAFADPAEKVITTTGNATAFVKPDTARIHYGVRVSEPSADAVKDVLTKTTTSIDEAIKKLKLAGVVISTAPVTIKQSQGNQAGLAVPVAPGAAAPGPGLGPFLGFTSHTATISEKDPEKLRAAVDAFVKAVTEAGANTGGGEERESNLGIGLPGQEANGGPRIVLSRDDDGSVREQLLQKAVAKAVGSARAIAKGLGAGEVKVVSVTDVPESEKTTPDSFLNIYGIETQASPRTPAGEVEIKVKVIVKCSY
ncbi:MAG TPA: SIMPL domain-containing protein [Gemmataceae bacterium]|jgi:uncharacterized protein YggE|nr:SIMPL domain-containing protein [Gemmataceae bacterium]